MQIGDGDGERSPGIMERGHNRDDKGGYHGEGSSSSYAPYGPNPFYHHLPQPVAVEKKWTSWLVPLIVLANIAMFVLTMYVNDCPSHRNRVLGNCVAEDVLHRFSFQPLSQNPLFGPSSRALKKLGALEWDRVVNQHQGWRLITCIWLHAGVVHIFANMLSLLFIGLSFEKQFGFVRVGIVYLLSGFGGSVFSSLFLRNNVSVGASGALFGLLGSMLSELITNWTLYSNRASALFNIVFIIIINLVIGMLPYVDNFAHIGGFITGFLSGFIFLLRPQYSWRASQNLPDGSRLKSKYKAYQLILLIVALILLVVWFLVTVIMLFKKENGNDHCSWCHYVTCIPTSRWQC